MIARAKARKPMNCSLTLFPRDDAGQPVGRCLPPVC
jgi:hypothetical protein